MDAPFSRSTACAIATLGMVASLIGGCETAPTTTGHRDSGLAKAEQAYRAGQWLNAYDEGTAAEATLASPDRERAALIAGSAAARLGELGRAQLLLTTAARSADGSVRGEALVTRASISESQGDRTSAVADLEAAIPLLANRDATRARAQLQRLQLASSVAATRPGATSPSTSASASAPSATRTKPTVPPAVTTAPEPAPAAATERWIMQAGVYTRKASATRRAAQLKPECDRLKLGDPVIEKTRVAGRAAYRVVLGIFSSRDNAENAVRQLGRTDVIVQAER
ncbi:MAG: SPOR domain-containing protein [Planctomycetota bacterium]|nr:SPOR domain-containing protein [Planctomycetota bacterium]